MEVNTVMDMEKLPEPGGNLIETSRHGLLFYI